MTTTQFTTVHDALGAHKIYALLSSYPVQADYSHRQQILKFFVSDTQDAVIVTADGVPLTITMHDGTVTSTMDKTRARGLWRWRIANCGAKPLPASG
jgi:hypothetical protein